MVVVCVYLCVVWCGVVEVFVVVVVVVVVVCGGGVCV